MYENTETETGCAISTNVIIIAKIEFIFAASISRLTFYSLQSLGIHVVLKIIFRKDYTRDFFYSGNYFHNFYSVYRPRLIIVMPTLQFERGRVVAL